MAEHGLTQSDDELGDALRTLGQQLRYPPTPDLVPGVRQGIQARPTPIRRSIGRPGRLAAVAAMLLMLILAVVLAIPTTRTTVAGWLNLPGVTFLFFADDRPVYGGELRLGEPITLDEARDAVAFDVLVPESLGEPDEVYLDTEPVGGAISFIYHADDEIPEAEETGVGILLSQFHGELNPNMYGKGIPGDATLEYLEINGRTAYWISGEAHTFSYQDSTGEYVEEAHRMAGNTLLWQDGAITLRLETALDRDTVLEIAGSMR